MIKSLTFKQNYLKFIAYVLLLLCMFFLNFTSKNFEPFALCVFVAMLFCNFNILLSSAFYVLSSIPNLNLTTTLIFAGQALFLAIVFFIYKKLNKKMDFALSIYLIIPLALFVIFYKIEAYNLPSFFSDLVLQKVLFAVIIYICCFASVIALKAIFFKLTRCKIPQEEFFCIACLLTLINIGLYKCVGFEAYKIISVFILLVYIYIVKNTSCVYLSLIFSIPISIVNFTLYPICLYLLYALGGILFVKTNKLCSAFFVIFCDLIINYLLKMLFSMEFTVEIIDLVVYIAPAILSLCIPDFIIKLASKKLEYYSDAKLTRLSINQNRQITGEKLFAISDVFKEIENAFSQIGDVEFNQTAAKNYILEELLSRICSDCPNYKKCKIANISNSFEKLISIGAVKGKVSLIDLSSEISTNCHSPNEIINYLNKLLTEYKNYMIELENADSGKALLASEAKAVSEMLKKLALEQGAPQIIYTEREKFIFEKLIRSGIICNELSVNAINDEYSVSLVIYGTVKLNKLTKIIGDALNTKMIVSEKVSLDNDRAYYILKKQPLFDACFGVAYAVKNGETISGDTHSVIKLSEKKFLVGLCDGSGSGEKARKVSDCAISLLESFYKADMPSEVIFNSVNKLLTFNKEETFACADIATVDLNSGVCDLIKIGSPLSFIISKDKIDILESNALPLGVIDNLRPNTCQKTLKENDMLIFISDGITSAFSSTTDICAFLQTLNPLNPQTIADKILNKAVSQDGGFSKDDMTVVCVRLFKKE